MEPARTTPSISTCLTALPPGTQLPGLSQVLHDLGFAVLTRDIGAEASLRLAASGECALVLWWCQDFGQLAALRRLQSAGVPVIALLGHPESAAVAACMDAGADACLDASSVDPRVAAAQIRAVLRRHSGHDRWDDERRLQLGDIVVDRDRCTVTRCGEVVPLTYTEFRILEYMVQRGGRVVRPHEVLNATSEDGYRYDPREAQEVFKVHARRIRGKLEPCPSQPRYLVNVRGFGYRLDGGEDARLEHEDVPKPVSVA